MTIQSHGYDGTVDEYAFAQLLGLVGRPPVAATPNDLTPTAVNGARAVLVGNGTAYGTGVAVTLSDGNNTVPLSTPTNGQFFLIALRRDWTINQDPNGDGVIDVDGSSLIAIAADLTAATTPSAPPAALPAMETTVGVKADQPICWAWTTSASTTVTIWDLRAYPETPEHVPTLTARDAIPATRLYPGKLVTVDSTGVRYRRSTSTWHIDGINPCTSGSHPADPFLYELIFETDTSKFGYWNGSAWVSGGGTTGTIADGSLPARLQATAKDISGTDWNTALESGWWKGQNVANSAKGNSDWTFVFVIRNDDTYVRQVAYDYFGAGIWTRYRLNGTWRSWVYLPNADDLNGGYLDGRYYTETEINGFRSNDLYDIARITHSSYGSGLNSFWQGYLPANYSSKGDVENRINSRGLAAMYSTAFLMSSGGGNRVSAGVTFPGGRFSSAPNIQVAANSSVPDNCSVSYLNRSASGVTVYLSRKDGSTGSPISTEVSVFAMQTY